MESNLLGFYSKEAFIHNNEMWFSYKGQNQWAVYACRKGNLLDAGSVTHVIDRYVYVASADPTAPDDLQLDFEVVTAAFNEFIANRPDEAIIRLLSENWKNEDPFKLYVNLLQACIYHQNTSLSDDRPDKIIDSAVRWLKGTDFFRAPASTVYHDSYAGGLCNHSLNVARHALNLQALPEFNQADPYETIYCALVHDWCKIGFYEVYQRNVKNEETGVWEKVDAFRYTDYEPVPLGHGVSSMYMASKFYKLTIEMCAAIRWHMGAFRTVNAEFSEMQHSIERFPMVLLLQTADQLALCNFTDNITKE